LNNVVEFSSKSNVFVRPIIGDEIDKFLPKVISIIKPSVDKSQRNTSMDDVIEDIMNARSLMWAVYIGDTLSAAFTTSIAEYPQRRTLFIEYMGGIAMAAWMKAALKVLTELAKKSKLDGIEAHGRIGFSKMAKEHGFKEMYRHFEMELA
jgi:hypothetical protein